MAAVIAEWLRTYGPTLLAWVLIVLRLLFWRQVPRTSLQRAGWLLLIGMAVSQTFNMPVVYGAVWRVTGVPNLSRLFVHTFMLLTAWAVQMVLMHINYEGEAARTRSRRRAWWLAVVVAVMAVLFALASTPVNDVRFARRYAGTPWVLEYWLAYIAYLLPTLVSAGRLCWRYSMRSIGFAMRAGLRMVVVGAVSGLVYHVHRAFYFAAYRFRLPYLPIGVSNTLDTVLPMVSHVMILIGATMPAWGPSMDLSRVSAWLRRYRAFHTLRPLWLALYRADPRIALVPPKPVLVELLSPQDLELRLYRRIIEIRDGRLTLLPYLDPAVAAAARGEAAAAGLTGQRLEAEEEAAALSAALEAKALERVPPGATALSTAVPGGSDVDSDLAFLCAVTRAFRRLHRHRSSPGRPGNALSN